MNLKYRGLKRSETRPSLVSGPGLMAVSGGSWQLVPRVTAQCPLATLEDSSPVSRSGDSEQCESVIWIQRKYTHCDVVNSMQDSAIRVGVMIFQFFYNLS